MNDSVYADCRMGKNVNTTNKTCKENTFSKITNDYNSNQFNLAFSGKQMCPMGKHMKQKRQRFRTSLRQRYSCRLLLTNTFWHWPQSFWTLFGSFQSH